MPPIVTSNATIMCVHGGQVTLIPKQTQVVIQGGACAVRRGPRRVAHRRLCPATKPGTKPCTAVVSTLPGSTSLKVLVAGRPAYVATLQGITDGVPPGTLIVANPGQASVQA